jgi:hypothetical protein
MDNDLELSTQLPELQHPLFVLRPVIQYMEGRGRVATSRSC